MRYMLIYTSDPDLESQWGDETRAGLSSWLEEAARTGTGLQGPACGRRRRPSR